MIKRYLERLPSGFSVGMYRDVKYGITKSSFNEGKSYKVFAQELGGVDFVSLNYYSTPQDDYLRPCEMPEQKVIDFLKDVLIIDNKGE